jgi:hypothetical protein
MDCDVTSIASKYKKTLLRKLKAVKKVPGHWPHRRGQGSRQYYFCTVQLQERTRKAEIQTSERPSISQYPNVLTGNVFVESVRTVMNGPYPS